MVHAPGGAPAPAPAPAWGEDDRQPQVLTDERGRRYALIPLAAEGAQVMPHPGAGATVAEASTATYHASARAVPGAPSSFALPDTLAGWRLTPREVDVALRVARGFTNKRIAHECGMREGTVKSHIHRLFHKLRVASRVELVLQLQRGARRGD